MRRLIYNLDEGGYINRFITTGVFAKPWKFRKTVQKGRVNEWLKKGFSIHDNPGRAEFIEERRSQTPEAPGMEAAFGAEVGVWGRKRTGEVYFPFGNTGYEASGFYSCPACLRTFCAAEVIAETGEEAVFEIETCGGVTIWNNGQLAGEFLPFTRNMVKRTSVQIPLKEGSNQLNVCLDDLAERDTDYYFRLRYTGSQELKICLSVPCSSDPTEIRRYESVLEHIFFEKEAYISEPVVLALPPQLIREDIMSCRITQKESGGKPGDGESRRNTRSCRLTVNQRRLTICQAEDYLPGYYSFIFGFRSGPVQICRRIGNQLVWKRFLAPGPESTAERKARYLETAIRYGTDNIYKAAAYLGTGGCVEEAERIIRKELPGVNAREDCSDFCFTMILYIYIRYGHSLSREIRSQIREAALNYRYWIDEPGDDVMWFFSENHALLFHLCQYLAGRAFPDGYFTSRGCTGKETEARGKELLEEWFDSFFREYITEWNSNAYIPIDVLGLATLYNLTEEGEELRAMAVRALDRIALNLAVCGHRGAVMTTFGRTYEKELKGNYNAGTTSLLYLFYNAGFLTRDGNGSMAVALGDYEAPEEYRKYAFLEEGEKLISRNTQGFEKHADLYLYKDKEVILSTAVHFRPFQKGYQEHITQAAVDETAQVFVNHPGEVHPYGSGRPGYWAGNGELPLAVQYGNLAILIYEISEENRIDYTHAYVPLNEFQEYKGEDGAIVLKKKGGCIGLKAEGGFRMVKNGPCTYREFRSPGRKNVWVLKVKSDCRYLAGEEFLEEMKEIQILREEGGVTVRDGETEYRAGYDGTFLVNGRAVYDYPLGTGGRIIVERDWHNGEIRQNNV